METSVPEPWHGGQLDSDIVVRRSSVILPKRLVLDAKSAKAT
jgi:hypothetical protein